MTVDRSMGELLERQCPGAGGYAAGPLYGYAEPLAAATSLADSPLPEPRTKGLSVNQVAGPLEELLELAAGAGADVAIAARKRDARLFSFECTSVSRSLMRCAACSANCAASAGRPRRNSALE